MKLFYTCIIAFCFITTKAQTSSSGTLDNYINEERFILINGIEQWVTIKGDSTKPPILFLHGGPGSPLTPYSDILYRNLEKDFIVIQWDQRGTGRTYGRNSPPEELTPEYLRANPLTVEQMTNDGITLSEYILKHFRKQKIILFGTSWGSALGVKMATKRPDLFYAYIGHSQIVNGTVSIEEYTKIYKMAEANNDIESLKILNTIGKPPYDKAKSVGQLNKVIKKYEKANSTSAPDNWFVPATDYDNNFDNKNRYEGDEYSFVNFVGDKPLGIQSMAASIDLMTDNREFKIPVYLIQGNEDILTPKELSKKYFEAISAPNKDYFLLSNTAHGFNLPVLETQFKIFKSIKTQ